MHLTYKMGTLGGMGDAGDQDSPDAKRTAPKDVRDYREVFNPPDRGRPVDRSLHSEPSEQITNYLEIARLVRPKKASAA